MPTSELIGSIHSRWRFGLDALIVLTLGFAAESLWTPVSPGPLANWVSGLPEGDHIARVGGFCAAALLVTAVHGLLRFLLDGDTHAGIITGLLLTVIVLWDWRGLVPILVMVFIGAEVTRRRHIGERGAGLATACVLAFPTAATILSLIFLDWRFTP